MKSPQFTPNASHLLIGLLAGGIGWFLGHNRSHPPQPMDATPSKPTLAQRFFASPWCQRLYFFIPVVAAMTVASLSTGISWDVLRDPVLAGWFGLMLLLTGCLGFSLAAFPGLLIVTLPIYLWRGKINGGPFTIGDQVQIIGGPNAGKISSVYAVWMGNSFRVLLGEAEQKVFSDVFNALQVMRAYGEPSGHEVT